MNQTYETFLSKCTGGDERFAMGRLAELSGIEYDEPTFKKWSIGKAKHTSGWLGNLQRRCQVP